MYLPYELDSWLVNHSNNSTMKTSLFSAVKLTRNAIKRMFIYNGFGLAFDGS